ncbi:MAG: penicillin-binding transpeptidase domain-containing protein, partial [Oscillospiraceae bacterium]
MKNDGNIKAATGASIKIRIWIIAAVFVFLGFGIIVRNLYVLQIQDYELYRAKATSQQLSDTIVVPNRGTIYDANMKVLAKSSTVWTVSVSPNVVKDEMVETTARVLSDVLGIEYEDIWGKLNDRKSQYQIVKKKIEKDVADALRTAIVDNELDGVYLTQDSKRYYPYGDFAAYVLGFTGGDNQGLEGVENYYDDVLTGTPGRIVSAKNGWGLNMPYEYAARYPSTDGNSIVLTLDETIQHFLEKHLDYAVKAHSVTQKGVGIVMNVKTGEILALDVKPSYDPNDPYKIVDPAVQEMLDALEPSEDKSKLQAEERQKQWRNKAISDQYEPGSVFKIVTSAGALDSGVCTVDSPFNCMGSINVAGQIMHCAHTEGHGGLTLATALINSCNPSFIQIGARMGKDSFYDYFNAFGLTEKTGVDLPGEAGSSFYTPDKMGPVELASCSFGQSSKITYLQMATAVAAAVNGGKLVQPHIVSQILDPNGNIIENISPEPKRQVVSAEVSQQICSILEENVISGQGVNAYVMGYRVG